MRILFISDLHLYSERPDLIRALLVFLREKAPQADQLFILGDLFEAWIGDDFITPDLQPVVSALKELTDNGTELFFQHGNRDFLVGERFSELTGAQILPDSHLLDLPSGKALLMHGDQLCTDDVEYQQLRIMLRNPAWQKDVLTKSVEERLMMAQQLRESSKASNTEKTQEIMDVNQDTVSTVINDAGVATLIHGHTHRPAIHPLDGDKRRIVLGDWDSQGWYFEVTDQAEELINFEIN